MHTVRRLPTVALGRAARRPRTAEPGDRRVIVAGSNGRTASNKNIEHLKNVGVTNAVGALEPLRPAL